MDGEPIQNFILDNISIKQLSSFSIDGFYVRNRKRKEGQTGNIKIKKTDFRVIRNSNSFL